MSLNDFSPKFRDELKQKYNELSGPYKKLVDEVLYILRESVGKHEIKIHSMNPRETTIKTFDSLYRNIIKKQIRENPFEVVEDIAGVRVICLYRSDLDRLGAMIRESFEVIRADTSRTRTETPFGYASDHYVVRLSEVCKGPRYDAIKNLKCEIQVRTILMDAWASVSHHLDYKQEVDIPRELRTNFNALGSLFYVADTNFELFKEGIEKARTSLMKTVQEDSLELDQEINLDSLTAYLKWKFPERNIKTVESAVVSELGEFGYKSIRQLDALYRKVSPVLKEYEKEDLELATLGGWKPRSPNILWAPEGLVRACLDLGDDAHANRGMPEDVREILKKYRSRLRA